MKSSFAKRVRVVIAFGSNIPDRLDFMRKALEELQSDSNLELTAVSPVYESPPEGENLSGDFLNAVAIFDTELSAGAFLRLLHDVENRLGRNRIIEKNTENRNRTIDLDIIFYGDEIIKEIDLIVPHPRWNTRPFVILPLMDILSYLTPIQRQLVDETLDSIDFDKLSSRVIEDSLD